MKTKLKETATERETANLLAIVESYIGVTLKNYKDAAAARLRDALLARLEEQTWRDPATDRPDADTVVLLLHPALGEPVWPGIWNGADWETTDHHIVTDHIVGWRDFPSFAGEATTTEDTDA